MVRIISPLDNLMPGSTFGESNEMLWVMAGRPRNRQSDTPNGTTTTQKKNKKSAAQEKNNQAHRRSKKIIPPSLFQIQQPLIWLIPGITFFPLLQCQ